MMQLSLVVVGLAAFAGAQSTHMVNVGSGGLKYSPETITAAAGDIVQFDFINDSLNHSVVQSSFNSPCKPMNGGLWSGYVSSGKSFSVKISNSNPMWIYCAQVSHCQAGMAMVINPPSSGDTLSAYKSAAQSATTSTPSESAPVGGTLGTTGGASGSSVAGMSSTMSSSASTTTAATATATTAMTATRATTGSTATTATGGSSPSMTSYSTSSPNSGSASTVPQNSVASHIHAEVVFMMVCGLWHLLF